MLGFNIGEALKDGIAMIARSHGPSQGDALAYSKAMDSLDVLTLLLASAANSGPPAPYSGPSALLAAYQTVCDAFAEVKRQKAKGRRVFPLLSLAYANALLNGEDPHEAVDNARELRGKKVPGCSRQTARVRRSIGVLKCRVRRQRESCSQFRRTPAVVRRRRSRDGYRREGL